MPASVRTVLAVATGGVVAILLAYLGAIVLLVARLGIPLGSEARDAGPVEYLGLLAIAGAAAAIGGHIAAGIARQHARAVAIALAALLALGAWWSFTRPASNWPAWWAPGLAVVLAAGTWAGGTVMGPRSGARRQG